MSIDHIFRGGPELKVHKGIIKVPRWFSIPDGKYSLFCCDDGGFKYIGVFPIQNHPGSLTLRLIGPEGEPEELSIRDQRMRLPSVFKEYIGIDKDRFRGLIIGRHSYFTIWEYNEFLKYSGITTQMELRKAA